MRVRHITSSKLQRPEDNTGGKAFALHESDSGSFPSTVFVVLKDPLGMTPEHKSRNIS